MSLSRKLKYRPEIDGLRAVAVIPVMFFHAGFPGFGGGFVGVDVFFVISGYLITSIIAEDLSKDRFSIADFYERRARRILPALFFVMLACVPMAWLWMFPGQMVEFSRSAIAVSVFLSNVYFWTRSGYFAEDSELMPLLHTWSLAVEEQFYIFFPIFLLLFWRLGRHRLLGLIIGITIVSFALAEWSSHRFASANFYLPHTRAWELMAGAICAFIIRERGVRNNGLLAWAGMLAILYSIVAFSEHTPFPGVYAIFPVVGTALVILFAGGENTLARVLSVKVVVGIGLVSYSAYLWHQPLFAFARLYSLNEPGRGLFAALCLPTFALAWFSWRFVEQPFRRRGKSPHSRTWCFTASFAGLAATALLGWFGLKGSGFPERVPESARALLAVSADKNPYRRYCHLGESRNVFDHPLENCDRYSNDGKFDVLMIGDSHLDAIGYELQEALLEQGLSSYAVSYSGCVALIGLYRVDADGSHKCEEYTLSMLRFAKARGINTIVHVARLPLYLHGQRYDNGEGGVERGGHAFVDVTSQAPRKSDWDSKKRQDRVLKQFEVSMRQILQDFNLIVVEPVPEPGWHVPQYLAKAAQRDKQVSATVSLEGYRDRTKDLVDTFTALRSDNFTLFKTSDYFCDNDSGRCRTTVSGLPAYRDTNHLSSIGARSFIGALSHRIIAVHFAAD